MNALQPVCYAGFWIRAGALFVDSAVLGIAWTASTLMVIPLVRWRGSPAAVQTAWRTVLWGMNLVFNMAYFAALTKRYGATPGKLAFGLRVVSVDGKRLRWKQVLLRETIGKCLSTLPLWFGFLRIGWAEKRQGWHDELAGTAVLITKPSLYDYGTPSPASSP